MLHLKTSDRITPACAGRSLRPSRAECSFQDHPRVCGEKLYRLHVKSSFIGSPPRVRGEAPPAMRAPTTLRITPACAGRRAQGLASKISTTDHPRVCGEKRPSASKTLYPVGSPPRVRGEDIHIVADQLDLGITPACAGRSGRQQCSGELPWDHPRVCGEKTMSGDRELGKPGSPPRVRGEARAHAHLERKTGITPACAGRSAHLCKLILLS